MLQKKKLYRKSKNTFCIQYHFFPENRTVYEKMWKNMEESGRPQITIRDVRIACWILKATNTLTICNTHRFSTATTNE